MGFRHLDQFAHVDSALTRRSPHVRLLGTVVLAVGAAVVPPGAWPQLAALGLLVLALAALGRIGPGPFLVRFAPPFTFVILVSAAVLVLAPGEVVGRLGPLRVTDAGVLRFGSVAGRAAVGLGAAVILVCTTSFPDIVRALRTLRLPDVVTTSLALAYHYLFLLTDEAARLRRAARSRNAADGAVPRRRLLVGITAVAFHRSLARSERVYQAMSSRGYTGRIPSLMAVAPSRRPAIEVGGLAVVVAVILASAAW